MDERSLVRLYIDLTGASESRARSVFMYVALEQSQSLASENRIVSRQLDQPKPVETRSSETSERRIRQQSIGEIFPQPVRLTTAVAS